jgi:hypothetical protein
MNLKYEFKNIIFSVNSLYRDYEYKKLDISSIYLGAVNTKGYYLANKDRNKIYPNFITAKIAGLKIIKKI